EEQALESCDAVITTDEALATWAYNASTHTGIRIAGVGDIDGDGYDDVALGWPEMATTGTTGEELIDAGVVYLYKGPIEGSFEKGDETARIDGSVSEDTVGWDITGLGDIDGDGYDDFAVGAADDPWNVPSGTPSVYLVHGPADATRFDSDMVLLEGGEVHDCLGAVITPFDDADEDGVADVLVSARCNGEVHLVSGGAENAQVPGDDDIATFYVPYKESDAYYPYNISSRFGHSLAQGDIDADGIADIVIGTPEPYAYLAYSDRDALGFAAVYSGPSTGVRAYDDADIIIAGVQSDTAYQSEGSTRLDLELGVGLSVADLNGDGYDDVVVGAPMRNEGDGDYQEGGVYIYFGPLHQPGYGIPDADLAILGDEDNDKIGGEMDAGHDLDGDGWNDLLVGEGRLEINGDQGSYGLGYASRAWVFLGPLTTGTREAASADFIIQGDEPATLGAQARVAGDTNADGLPELLVGDQALHLYLFDLPSSDAY
ncbi:MAG: hypothetical protein GXP62_17650, partial [Oligoflexia bacterium]|nr:hypothetical protein [Oligoflexia bacterium]